MSSPDQTAPDQTAKDQTAKDQTAKDVAYTPGSDRETDELQKSQQSAATEGVDPDAVETLPGTGGPDDNGSVDVPDADLNVPRDTGAH